MDAKPQNTSIAFTDKPIAAFLLSTQINLSFQLLYIVTDSHILLKLFTEDELGLPV